MQGVAKLSSTSQERVSMKKYTRVLTIAGSDSGGGAGIQADLKTFQATGSYGMSVITAITAQNTLGVRAIHPIPVEMIQAQLAAVLDDIGTDAVKIGMLHSAEVIEAVAAALAEYDDVPVVLDPVMVATSGDRLIQDDAVATMKEKLFPVASVITPNLPETEVLLERKITSLWEMKEGAAELASKYDIAVLVKGGHLDAEKVEDILHSSGQLVVYENPRVQTKNSHGTGCTLSSAAASYLAQGKSLPEAVELAVGYVHGALAAGADYSLGHGSGPVDHSFLMNN